MCYSRQKFMSMDVVCASVYLCVSSLGSLLSRLRCGGGDAGAPGNCGKLQFIHLSPSCPSMRHRHSIMTSQNNVLFKTTMMLIIKQKVKSFQIRSVTCRTQAAQIQSSRTVLLWRPVISESSLISQLRGPCRSANLRLCHNFKSAPKDQSYLFILTLQKMSSESIRGNICKQKIQAE